MGMIILDKAKEVKKMQEPQTQAQAAGLACPDCGSKELKRDYARAEIICNKCGLVLDDNIIDSGPEWRAFDSDQASKRARTGAPIKYTKPNKGLATEIDQYNRDIRGVKISSQSRAQMYRLRKWHKRTSISSSMERNLAIALSELDRIASSLSLPSNVREASALLYRKAVEKGLIRGRLIESVVAAVLYTICRQYLIPRTLDEISEISGINKKEIGRTYRFLKRDLGIVMPLTNPTHYIPRFASDLGLSGNVQEKAREILELAIKQGLISGRGPTGVAAAAVYIAGVLMGERKTQKEVADTAGVTEVTIRNRYRELKDRLGLDVPA
jgi:transcription initiation factor TFIIB